ncbi:hypothetical protein Tco_1003574 [Tanacetum coccineum]|uniref:Uncharacterized protein n=1 Tax=Tanacetum coccineum TaxID=301880 RepID=A0ABQ5F9U3_9ASTR
MSNTSIEDLLAMFKKHRLEIKEIIEASIARIDSIMTNKAEEETSAKEAKESSYEEADNIKAIGKLVAAKDRESSSKPITREGSGQQTKEPKKPENASAASVDPMVIESHAFEYFVGHYKESNHHLPRFHNDLFLKLDISEAGNLEAKFTMDELKEAVWSCSSIKSSGPDGFNFMFLKQYWDILKFSLFS